MLCRPRSHKLGSRANGLSRKCNIRDTGNRSESLRVAASALRANAGDELYSLRVGHECLRLAKRIRAEQFLALDTSDRLGEQQLAEALLAHHRRYMTMPPTTRPTSLSTDAAKVVTLVTLELQVNGAACRLRAFGHPLRGVREMHEWRFTQSTLTAGLLDEVAALMDSLAATAVVAALGIQGELALALLEPPEPI